MYKPTAADVCRDIDGSILRQVADEQKQKRHTRLRNVALAVAFWAALAIFYIGLITITR